MRGEEYDEEHKEEHQEPGVDPEAMVDAGHGVTSSRRLYKC